MKTASYIKSIGIATPRNKITQADLARFMGNFLPFENGDHRKLLAIYRASGIKYRYSVLEDFTSKDGALHFLPGDFQKPFPGVSERMKVFRREAIELAFTAVNDCFKNLENTNPITHIITVSCTGMYAPGLDIELIDRLGISPNVQRTAVNYMGCYAAFNAIKTGDSICKANPSARVLIVCVELCSIHLQKKVDADNLLANALFGDGCAAVIMEASPEGDCALEPINFHCDLLSSGKNDMAWDIGDFGFEMRLSAYVPEVIRSGIKKLTSGLLKKMDLTLEQIDYFAIHPGGKKILKAIEEELGISTDENRFSYEVLSNYGNMSSPTVLFVLRKIWDQLVAKDRNEIILSFAFGPGVTLESMLLQVHHR